MTSKLKRGGLIDLPMMELPAFDLPTGLGIPDFSDGGGFGDAGELGGFGNLLGDPGEEQKSVEQKVAEVKTGFMARANGEAKRTELVTDSEFWCCLCFETREQKNAFLVATGFGEADDKYVDGRVVARKMGIDPGAKVQWPKTKGLSDRLKRHVE